MNATCDKCGYTPTKVRKSLRRDLAQCDDCGQVLCDKCLKKMVIKKHLMSVPVANVISNVHRADGFMCDCEASGLTLCPECFEAKEK